MKKGTYYLIIAAAIFLVLAGAGRVHAQYIEVSPESLGFFGVPIGSAAVQTITITNTGAGDAYLDGIAITFNP